MLARRTMVSWGYIAVGAVGAVAVMVVPLALFGLPTGRSIATRRGWWSCR